MYKLPAVTSKSFIYSRSTDLVLMIVYKTDNNLFSHMTFDFAFECCFKNKLKRVRVFVKKFIKRHFVSFYHFNGILFFTERDFSA